MAAFFFEWTKIKTVSNFIHILSCSISIQLLPLVGCNSILFSLYIKTSRQFYDLLKSSLLLFTPFVVTRRSTSRKNSKHLVTNVFSMHFFLHAIKASNIHSISNSGKAKRSEDTRCHPKTWQFHQQLKSRED